MPETHTVPLSLNNCTLATPFWPADHSFRPHCSFPLILCSASVMYSSFYMPLITCMLGGSNIVYNNNKTVHIWRQCHFWITLVSRNQPVRSRAPNPGINPHFVVTLTRAHAHTLISVISKYIQLTATMDLRTIDHLVARTDSPTPVGMAESLGIWWCLHAIYTHTPFLYGN